MARSKSQEGWARTALRLPAEVHEQVHLFASAEDRTFNSQIVAMLREGIAQRGQKEAKHEKQA